MEFIKANNTDYECKEVNTGIDSISFTMENQTIEEIHTTFKDVTELTVSSEDGTVYGIYENLMFASVTLNAENIITVTFRIKSDEEVRLDNLEMSQTEQDNLLAELMFGGEE